MKKLLFLILSSVFILIIPNLKVSAMEFNMPIQFHNKQFIDIQQGTLSLEGSNTFVKTFSFNKTFTCATSYCVVSFPLSATLDVYNNEYTSSGSNGIYRIVDILSFVTFTYQGSNDMSCSFNGNTLDCLVEKDKPLGGVQLAISKISTSNDTAVDYAKLHYYFGGYINVYSLIDNVATYNTLNSSINNVNDSINNDSVSTNTENSSTASSWASNNASDSVVSDMVLMPITLLNAFSNGFNGSCQAYNLGSLYGTNLTLPCINISNYLGATLWGIIDVLMSGFLIYGIGKKFVRVFNDFTNLKDSQVDELYGGGNE